MTNYGVALFHTTSSAMRAEKILAKASYNVKLIPVPRQFSSDCGIALRFDWAQHEQIKSLLNEEQVETDAIYPM